MANIAHEVERSKGCKSRKCSDEDRGSQASGKPAHREVGGEVSQTAVSVLILLLCSGQAEQKLHTEAIRSDEVSHAAEVQSLFFF